VYTERRNSNKRRNWNFINSNKSISTSFKES